MWVVWQKGRTTKLANILRRIAAVRHAFSGRISFRRDRAPIDSVVRLEAFVASRAALIAQKTLYGYLKTRMGTRYPLMFDDDVFVESVNVAKYHVFAACLSDLTVHAVARATHLAELDDMARRSLAERCFRTALEQNLADAPDSLAPGAFIAAFTERLAGTGWGEAALHRSVFDHSAAALVRWAPIAPDLKRLDREIVENSIRFAWRDIREDLGRRLDAEAVGNALAEEFAGMVENGGSHRQ